MQRSFFADEPEESFSFQQWNESEPISLAQIVFPNGLDKAFDYRVPDELDDLLLPGMRVMVPFGKGNHATLGYCVGRGMGKAGGWRPEAGGDAAAPLLNHERIENFESSKSDNFTNSLESPIRPSGLRPPASGLKTIQSVVDSQRLLSDRMLQIARWIADYYFCPLGTVLEAMLPAGVRGNAATRLTTVLLLDEQYEKKLEQLKKAGGRMREAGANPPQSPIPNPQSPILTPKQLHVLDVLKKHTEQGAEPLSVTELTRAAKCSQAPIQALKRLGLIRAKTIRRETAPKFENETEILTADQIEHKLNPQQQKALDAIVDCVYKMEHRVFLLHGVTGSGKTEVYIRAIEQVVKNDKQAIVLVPEISLTPQTVGRFKGRFPNVAVLHSHLTDAERNRQWNKIVRGEVQVVVGARSAVFAPVPHLGLLIIDEEHENSFKQDTAPRYHARDVARRRAELESVPLILGSATPSLESWHLATRLEAGGRRLEGEAPAPLVNHGYSENSNLPNPADFTKAVDLPNSPLRPPASGLQPFQLLSMSNRVLGRRLPNVKTVDLREAVRERTTRGAIHRQLHAAISESLSRKEQVILLLNRRGFSTQIQCQACGTAVRCPDCDVSLTHHRTEEIALCHYCDYQIPAPAKCPECGFLGIRYSGFGTQKLEQEIRERFPKASVLRMDTDTMQGHGAHERALQRFRSGEIQILLGTQMIAKGLDFPNVTLVGVINSDTALHLPDFRASERTFHLITQVAGRTGRGEKGGRVIVQTFSPDHPAILAAAQHNYLRFVATELPLRELLGYPPYSKMVRFVFRGPNEEITKKFATDFTAQLRSVLEQGDLYLRSAEVKTVLRSENQKPPKFRLLGPAPAPFAKLRTFYRFHLHLHAYDADFLHWALRRMFETMKTQKTPKVPDQVQWIVDVDPVDML